MQRQLAALKYFQKKTPSPMFGRVLNTPLSKINQSQLVFTCSNMTVETLEQGVKYVQS